jgi:hypothetical protein
MEKITQLRPIRPLTAAICTFVHHKGWCASFHKEVETWATDGWRSGCPFKDTAMFCLFPPFVIGKIDNNELADALKRPGIIKNGRSD